MGQRTAIYGLALHAKNLKGEIRSMALLLIMATIPRAFAQRIVPAHTTIMHCNGAYIASLVVTYKTLSRTRT